MLTLTTPYTPSTSNPAPSLSLEMGANVAPFTTLASGDLLSVQEVVSLPSPSVTDGVLTLTLAPDTLLGGVASVTINGVPYPDFVYLPPGTIAVSVGDFSIPAGSSAVVSGRRRSYPPNAPLPGNRIIRSLPSLLLQWNAIGEIPITRQFEQHPSSSFTFVCASTLESDVFDLLREETEVELFGIGYRVTGLQVEQLIGQPLIRVAVQLGGKWEEAIEESVYLRGIRNVADVATRASIPLSAPAMAIAVPADTSTEETTSLSSELQGRIRTVGGFLYLSNPNTVEVRRWGETPLHLLTAADLLPVSDGVLYSKTPQKQLEYRNTELLLDSGAGEVDDEGNPVRRNIEIVLYEGDPNPGEPPLNITLEDPDATDVDQRLNFRSNSIWFDQGGVTKTRTQVRRLNGQPVSEISVTFGFLGSSIDTHILVSQGAGVPALPVFKSNIDPRLYWAQVEYRETRYFYNDENYLIGVRATGWRKARMEQEQNNDAVVLRASLDFDAPNLEPAEIARRNEEIELYTDFKDLPIDDFTFHRLAPFRGRYPDIQRPTNPDELEEWVEPRYVIERQRRDNSVEVQPDPRSTQFDPRPPISTGKNFFESEKLNIIYPPEGIRRSDWSQEREIYSAHTITQNAEGGGNLKNALVIENRSDSDGRQSVQTRRELYDDPLSITVRVDGPDGRFYLRTPNTPANAISDGTISFPGVTDPELGRQAAELDLAIRNSQSEEVWSVRVLPSWEICEGDRVSLEGRLFNVLSVERTVQIGGEGLLLCDGVGLQLGRIVDIPVTLH